jgi:DNA-binding CsgD family transcriptional regulator
LVTQFVCAGVLGDEPATRALIDEARGPTLESMDGNVVRRFFTNSAFVLHGFARYEEALDVALAGIEAERRAGSNPHGQMCIYENAAELMCILGRPRDAAELLGDEIGAYSSDTSLMHTTRGRIALQLGDLTAAQDEATKAIAEPDLADALLLAGAAPMAEAALWNGNLEAALDACARGEAALLEDDKIASSSTLAIAIRVQADGAETGALDRAAARVEADRLLARLERVATDGIRVPESDAHLLSGAAERSRLADEPDPAAWQAATEAWSAIGRRYEAAHSGWRWAQAIAASHGPRDALERVLTEARARAADIGSTHLVEVCEALARRSRLVLPGMRDDDGSAFPDLTPREREVLALVADGRTNRQIAQELFITDKTASVHVSNILSKLGASNRGEAAALAHRAGLESLDPVDQRA